MLARIVEHPKTSLSGAALGGIFYYLMSSWHCQLPKDAVDWVKWITVAGPVVLGMLSKD